jgi:hypothetical protein
MAAHGPILPNSASAMADGGNAEQIDSMRAVPFVPHFGSFHSHGKIQPDALTTCSTCRSRSISGTISQGCRTRNSWSALSKLGRLTRRQKPRPGLTNCSPRFAVQSDILRAYAFLSWVGVSSGIAWAFRPSFSLGVEGLLSERRRTLIRMHLALCEARDITDEMERRVANR